MKICKKCNLEKSLSEFNRRIDSKDGYRGSCKNCQKGDKGLISKYQKEYRNKNSDRIKDYQSTPERSEYLKNYREKNRERKRAYDNSKWSEKKIKYADKRKKWYESNKDIIKEYNKSYMPIYKKRRMSIDPVYKISISIGDLIRQSLKKNGFTKKSRSHNILGCSFEEFKRYIESKFENWMNWENKGIYNGEINYGWDLDHIIPISSAKTEDDILKLNHYTNFQPLDGYINRYIKRNKINV